MGQLLPGKRNSVVEPSHLQDGLRVIAIVEFIKGILILLAGFGVLSLIHHDVQLLAEEIVGHFYLNPASRYPRIFIDLAGQLTDTRLWILAGFAFAYSGLRFIEAYGLWRRRRWAEWFAVVSGALYIPIELFELLAGLSWIKVLTFAVNVGIVSYVGLTLWRSQKNNLSVPA
ncbi:DUF2127 domain-containing protein [Methylocaldum szegediense]|uniref:Uncharacterized membrane protein (DUF2068 family) n=1 Tax=Methylocaldum szegediense TaxID=73780 RepID=A0ABM9I5X5_9GAMM|nr:DUF2127 domain-containing protein [Methylocaldum szegediense]CAI8912692.1 Uncharacterized membrane protein (DUF2068 family) [Methylocaldum szegediense]